MAATKARSRATTSRKATPVRRTVARKAPARSKAPARKAPARAAATRTKIQVMVVKVASLPGNSKDVTLAPGKNTLNDAISAFGLSRARVKDVRVNNRQVRAGENPVLEQGSLVTIVGQVNGGRST